jgi:hypothetical protein
LNQGVRRLNQGGSLLPMAKHFSRDLSEWPWSPLDKSLVASDGFRGIGRINEYYQGCQRWLGSEVKPGAWSPLNPDIGGIGLMTGLILRTKRKIHC